jgi:hypothetical protein
MMKYHAHKMRVGPGNGREQPMIRAQKRKPGETGRVRGAGGGAVAF